MEGDTRELILPSTQLIVPDRPGEKLLAQLSEHSADQWMITAGDWARAQVLRLAIAAVLEAQLLHTRAERLDRFDLVANPERVTLAQLAALFRPHNGSAGQAFELAVADAVNAGVAGVVEPIREALRLVGVTEPGPIGMIALGLEKVPADAQRDFWEAVAATLGPDAVLRTGLRGRPATLATVIRRFSDSTWRSMTTPHGVDTERHRQTTSQLGRADAMLHGPGWMTPVSFKIQSRHVRYGWRDVPLWITQSGDESTSIRAESAPSDTPLVVVRLAQLGWLTVFNGAVETVYRAMTWIDLGRRPRPSFEVGHIGVSRLVTAAVNRLVEARHRTVGDVCISLRSVDPVAVKLFNDQTAATAARTAAVVVDDDRFAGLWLPSQGSSPLIVGQRHLFVPDEAPFMVTEHHPGNGTGFRRHVVYPGADSAGDAPDRPPQPQH